MQIKFHETLYDLVDRPNIQTIHFQATIEKGENSYDDIIADTVNAEEITVYDDEGEVQGIYNGYTKRIAICIMDHISIELENVNITGAIDNLSQQVSSLEETQTEQANSISELNDEVEELTPYTDTKTGYYGETEKTFYNVPEGNVLVFFDNYSGSYSVNRVEDRLTVSFDALDKETNITISVQ